MVLATVGAENMKKITCSLCGKTKAAKPLDSDDLLFSAYIRLSRRLGRSKHNGKVGICKGCMKDYERMLAGYQKKKITYFVIAVVFALLYFYFTGNALVSLLLGVFIVALSLLSYCPPLKK